MVGLLSQRFGTPTAIYESGTEEEFETAIRFRKEQGDWPEIKWFFRDTWGKQGPPDDPDQLMEAGLQWKKVRDFMANLQNSEPPLHTKSFKATDDFPAIFRQDLERWLNDPARHWSLKHTKRPEQPEPDIPIQETPTFRPGLNSSQMNAPICRWKSWTLTMDLNRPIPLVCRTYLYRLKPLLRQ